MDEERTQSERDVWKEITPFSKYLAMILFVALPFFGGWVGYTYAPEKIVEIKITETEVIPHTKVETTAYPESTATSSRMVSCFADKQSITEAIDTWEWSRMQLERFTMGHPEYIEITREGSETNIENGVTYLIKDHKNDQQASLEVELYGDLYIHSPWETLVFESYSQTWWFPGNGSSAKYQSDATQCYPNAIATTAFGHPIYLRETGDGGNTFNTYYIPASEVPRKLNEYTRYYYTPVTIIVSTGKDPNTEPGYSDFLTILETMLQTIELKKTEDLG